MKNERDALVLIRQLAREEKWDEINEIANEGVFLSDSSRYSKKRSKKALSLSESSPDKTTASGQPDPKKG